MQRKQSLYELAKIELNHNHPDSALQHLQNYSQLSMNDSMLLTMAIEAAHRVGNTMSEAAYQLRLTKLKNFTDHTGEKNDNHDNG